MASTHELRQLKTEVIQIFECMYRRAIYSPGTTIRSHYPDEDLAYNCGEEGIIIISQTECDQMEESLLHVGYGIEADERQQLSEQSHQLIHLWKKTMQQPYPYPTLDSQYRLKQHVGNPLGAYTGSYDCAAGKLENMKNRLLAAVDHQIQNGPAPKLDFCNKPWIQRTDTAEERLRVKMTPTLFDWAKVISKNSGITTTDLATELASQNSNPKKHVNSQIRNLRNGLKEIWVGIDEERSQYKLVHDPDAALPKTPPECLQ
jgi:hypothetical protein